MRAWTLFATLLVALHNQAAAQHAIRAMSPTIMNKARWAPKGRITSAFTKLEPCRPVVPLKEAYSVAQCRGFAGVPLFLQYGDERYDISAGVNDGGEDFGGPFNSTGDTIEWRLLNGKPFAIIFRIIVDAAIEGRTDSPKSSRLMVETIGNHPCRIAEIPGSTPNANAVARAAADQMLKGKTKCIHLPARG